MDAYVITLRIVHILAGAFWLGAGVVFVAFLEPAAKELGTPGQAFMANVSAKRRLPIVIAVASLVNIVAGLLLYWRGSGGLQSAWITSGPGIGFTLGGAAAVVSWLVGFFVSRPTIDRLATAAAGGAQPAEIVRLQARLRLAGRVGLGLLVVAAAAMASARYL